MGKPIFCMKGRKKKDRKGLRPYMQGGGEGLLCLPDQVNGGGGMLNFSFNGKRRNLDHLCTRGRGGKKKGDTGSHILRVRGKIDFLIQGGGKNGQKFLVEGKGDSGEDHGKEKKKKEANS